MKITLTEQELNSIAGTLLLEQDYRQQVKNVQGQVHLALAEVLASEGITVCLHCLNWNYTTDMICADCRIGGGL